MGYGICIKCDRYRKLLPSFPHIGIQTKMASNKNTALMLTTVTCLILSRCIFAGHLDIKAKLTFYCP